MMDLTQELNERLDRVRRLGLDYHFERMEEIAFGGDPYVYDSVIRGHVVLDDNSLRLEFGYGKKDGDDMDEWMVLLEEALHRNFSQRNRR